MAFSVPDLPYPYNGLEPHIDEQTMRVHHDKHHAAYVTNLNAAIEGTQWDGRPIEQVLAERARRVEEALATRARAVFAEASRAGEPDPVLLAAALRDEPFEIAVRLLALALPPERADEHLRLQRLEAAVGRFGSGWAWLVSDGGKLSVTSTPNQDSPIMEGAFPIVGLDVWEHAYYLKYQNRRPDYVAAWWNVVNWPEVARRYEGGR